jgi:ATP phosphoribosyltransferase
MKYEKLTIGLPSGRLQQAAYELFARQGLRSKAFEKEFDNSIYKYEGDDVVFRIKKPTDIPQAVDGGYNDFGVCGFDSLREYELSNITPSGAMAGRGFVSDVIDDLGLTKMGFSIAGNPNDFETYKTKLTNEMPLVIATSYPEILRSYFAKKYPGKLIDIRTLCGKVEGAIDEYGDDAIFDIVETGGTLKKNGLVEYEKNVLNNPTKLLLSRTAIRKDPRVLKIAQEIKNGL